MRRVATILSIAAVTAAFATISSAEPVQPSPQGRGPAAMRAPRGDFGNLESRLSLMKERLALSEEQTAAIKPLIEAEQQELEKLRGDSSMNRDQRRAKLQELNKATSEKIREKLTPEQQAKYDTIKTKIAENRGKVRSAQPGVVPAEFTPEKRLARMNSYLDLSKEQQDKMLPILQDEYAELQKLPGNDSYNRDQRRAKLQQITKETNAKLMPILTPEQQKKYVTAKDRIADRRSQKKRAMEKTGQPAKQ